MDNNQSICEAYFVALGWGKIINNPDTDPKTYWIDADINAHLSLPNILEHYPDFKKWVLEKMAWDNYYLWVDPISEEIEWSDYLETGAPAYQESIIKNNILHAAVISATRYFEEKK